MTPIPCPELMILWICWSVSSGSLLWICQDSVCDTFWLVSVQVMPFGLCGAPATFERLMDRVLQGLRWSRCLVYLDDIISFGSTFSDALDNLTLTFQTSVPFLGHIVGRRGLECDPVKIEDVRSWPVPDCLKSVRLLVSAIIDDLYQILPILQLPWWH